MPENPPEEKDTALIKFDPAVNYFQALGLAKTAVLSLTKAEEQQSSIKAAYDTKFKALGKPENDDYNQIEAAKLAKAYQVLSNPAALSDYLAQREEYLNSQSTYTRAELDISKDYYQILGIDKNAMKANIKKAYHQAMRIAHTDKGGDTTKAQLINEAYRVLSNPGLRVRYDAARTSSRTQPKPKVEPIVPIPDTAEELIAELQPVIRNYEVDPSFWTKLFNHEVIKGVKSYDKFRIYRKESPLGKLKRKIERLGDPAGNIHRWLLRFFVACILFEDDKETIASQTSLKFRGLDLHDRKEGPRKIALDELGLNYEKRCKKAEELVEKYFSNIGKNNDYPFSTLIEELAIIDTMLLYDEWDAMKNLYENLYNPLFQLKKTREAEDTKNTLSSAGLEAILDIITSDIWDRVTGKDKYPVFMPSFSVKSPEPSSAESKRSECTETYNARRNLVIYQGVAEQVVTLTVETDKAKLDAIVKEYFAEPINQKIAKLQQEADAGDELASEKIVQLQNYLNEINVIVAEQTKGWGTQALELPKDKETKTIVDYATNADKRYAHRSAPIYRAIIKKSKEYIEPAVNKDTPNPKAVIAQQRGHVGYLITNFVRKLVSNFIGGIISVAFLGLPTLSVGFRNFFFNHNTASKRLMQHSEREISNRLKKARKQYDITEDEKCETGKVSTPNH